MLKENNKIVYTLIIAIILLFSLLDYFFGIKYFGSIYGYIVKPSLWLMLFIIIYFLFRRTKLTPGKHKKDINFIMIVLTITYFLIFFSLGYIKGFNISVYNKSLGGIFINLYSIVPIILVKEYLRLYMVSNLTMDKKTTKLILISILLFIPDINICNFLSDLETSTGSLQFLFATLIPKLSISFFLTFVVYYSHNLIAYFYLLFPVTLNFIIPYLPNIDWFLEGILITSFVFIGFLMINSQILKNNQQKENPITVQEFKNSWTIPTIIFSIYIPFMASFLFINPVVIASNSMHPIFNKGDIIIIKKVNMTELKKGDIIRYNIDDISVVHRIKSIEIDMLGEKYYITQGDNNQGVDTFPVVEDQITGKYCLRIPYIGYPTLILGELLSNKSEIPNFIEIG